jgi:hypothetical protein
MKLGDSCFISTLPTNVFPVDIALGIQEIGKGNNITRKDDEVETHEIILQLGPLTTREKTSLHPDIKSRCSNSGLQHFEEVSVSKDQSDELRKGKIISFDSKHSKRSQGCKIMVISLQMLYIF